MLEILPKHFVAMPGCLHLHLANTVLFFLSVSPALLITASSRRTGFS